MQFLFDCIESCDWINDVLQLASLSPIVALFLSLKDMYSEQYMKVNGT